MAPGKRRLRNLLSFEGIYSLKGMNARSKVGHCAVKDLKAAHGLQGNPQPIATQRNGGRAESYCVTPASALRRGDPIVGGYRPLKNPSVGGGDFWLERRWCVQRGESLTTHTKQMTNQQAAQQALEEAQRTQFAWAGFILILLCL